MVVQEWQSELGTILKLRLLSNNIIVELDGNRITLSKNYKDEIKFKLAKNGFKCIKSEIYREPLLCKRGTRQF